MYGIKSKLTDDELVARLARELFDLRQKLESIRIQAEVIDKEVGKLKKPSAKINYAIIDIINCIDEATVYEIQ